MYHVVVCHAQNVGIGTATPAEKLDVNGNVNLSGQLKVNGNAGTANQVLMKDGSNNLEWGAGGSAGISLAAVGSTPNANGATITGSVLNLQPASSGYPGVVATTLQSFAGSKTFNDSLVLRGPTFVLKLPTINGDTATGTTLYGNFYHTLSQAYVNPDGQRDAVYMIGYNQNGVGAAKNPNEAEMHLAMESRYQAFAGAQPQFEMHIQTLNKAGTVLTRHFSMNVNKVTGVSTNFWHINSVQWFPCDTSKVPYFGIGSTGQHQS